MPFGSGGGGGGGGLLAFLFPPPPTVPELVRRHELPGLVKVAHKEGFAQSMNKPLDGDGNTPLILAASCGAYRIVDWLVGHPELELDARNRFGWTALYEAAGTGNRHVLERLVQAGANPKIPATAWPRQTPAQMAKQMGFHACVEVLVQAEKAFAEKENEAARLKKQQEQEAAAALNPAQDKEGEEHGEGGEEEAKDEGARAAKAGTGESSSGAALSPSPPPYQASEEAQTVSESAASEDEDPAAAGANGTEAGAAAGAKELPACLRWQVEEGVGEWQHHRLAWDEDDFLLEVHPVVWSKRGPRVGRHRQRSRGETLVDSLMCWKRVGGHRGLSAPFHHHPTGRMGRRRRGMKKWVAESAAP